MNADWEDQKKDLNQVPFPSRLRVSYFEKDGGGTRTVLPAYV